MFLPNRRLRAEDGLSLVEVMAAVVVASLATLAALGVVTSTLRFFTHSAGTAETLADTTNVYWTLERLALKANAIGTDTVSDSGTGTFVEGATSGSVPVLGLQVSNLDGVVPASSTVYRSVYDGDPFVALAVVPVQGIPTLCLFPGRDAYNPSATSAVYPPAADLTPITSHNTDYSGSTFVVTNQGGLSAAWQFDVTLHRHVARAGTFSGSTAESDSTITYPFAIEAYGF